MKKYLSPILAAAACLLVVICMVQISRLNQRISTLESNMINQISYVRNEVNGISSNISDSLEEQASLLADSSWKYGEADYDTRTVKLICSVSPKEYESGTEAAIVVDGAEYPMTLSGGAFTVHVDIPLFGEVHAAKVMLREGEVVRTELLDWYLSPRYDYLLNVYADLSGSATGSPRDGIYNYHREGVMNISVDCKRPYEVKAVTLVELLDGKELGRTSIPLDSTEFYENYQNGNGAMPEPAANVAQPVGVDPVGPFYYELEKDYEIPYGSTWTLYVEIEDGNSLVYRCVIDRQNISDSGEPIDEYHWWQGSEASIYDSDGNVLYAHNPELYQ